ncbi:MAG: PHP domain-containing protein [Clostridia bacterium]|nr:PHP domain-containing protein [Clostridia bacterium]
MIDLHIHSKYSDGTDSVIDILKKAQKIGLKCISITDHNTCIAYDDFKKINIKEYYTGKIINGVELSTTLERAIIELLGYGVDIDYINDVTSKIYVSSKEIEEAQIKRACEKYKMIGIILDVDILDREMDEKFVSTFMHKHIVKHPDNMNYLKDTESWNNTYIFYRKHFTNPKSPFFVDISDLIPSCETIINLIKESGGLVFIPHIYIYEENSKYILEYLMNNYKIDGIECYYSLYKDEQTEFLIDYCRKNNLYISGGTDYHGKFKSYINMGIGKNNLNIPFEILNNWIGKVIKN